MILILSDSGIKLYKNVKQNQYMNLKLQLIKHTVIAILVAIVAIICSFIEVYISTNSLFFLKKFL